MAVRKISVSASVGNERRLAVAQAGVGFGLQPDGRRAFWRAARMQHGAYEVSIIFTFGGMSSVKKSHPSRVYTFHCNQRCEDLELILRGACCRSHQAYGPTNSRHWRRDCWRRLRPFAGRRSSACGLRRSHPRRRDVCGAGRGRFTFSTQRRSLRSACFQLRWTARRRAARQPLRPCAASQWSCRQR